jgi:hypothetical protein
MKNLGEGTEVILLLTEVENIHLLNSELALESIVFKEYVQMALLVEGVEKCRKLLFSCLYLIGLLQRTNVRVCGTISKTNVKEINMGRGKEIFNI